MLRAKEGRGEGLKKREMLGDSDFKVQVALPMPLGA